MDAQRRIFNFLLLISLLLYVGKSQGQNYPPQVPLDANKGKNTDEKIVEFRIAEKHSDPQNALDTDKNNSSFDSIEAENKKTKLHEEEDIIMESPSKIISQMEQENESTGEKKHCHKRSDDAKELNSWPLSKRKAREPIALILKSLEQSSETDPKHINAVETSYEVHKVFRQDFVDDKSLPDKFSQTNDFNIFPLFLPQNSQPLQVPIQAESMSLQTSAEVTESSIQQPLQTEKTLSLSNTFSLIDVEMVTPIIEFGHLKEHELETEALTTKLPVLFSETPEQNETSELRTETQHMQFEITGGLQGIEGMTTMGSNEETVEPNLALEHPFYDDKVISEEINSSNLTEKVISGPESKSVSPMEAKLVKKNFKIFEEVQLFSENQNMITEPIPIEKRDNLLSEKQDILDQNRNKSPEVKKLPGQVFQGNPIQIIFMGKKPNSYVVASRVKDVPSNGVSPNPQVVYSDTRGNIQQQFPLKMVNAHSFGQDTISYQNLNHGASSLARLNQIKDNEQRAAFKISNPLYPDSELNFDKTIIPVIGRTFSRFRRNIDSLRNHKNGEIRSRLFIAKRTTGLNKHAKRISNNFMETDESKTMRNTVRNAKDHDKNSQSTLLKEIDDESNRINEVISQNLKVLTKLQTSTQKVSSTETTERKKLGKEQSIYYLSSQHTASGAIFAFDIVLFLGLLFFCMYFCGSYALNRSMLFIGTVGNYNFLYNGCFGFFPEWAYIPFFLNQECVGSTMLASSHIVDFQMPCTDVLLEDGEMSNYLHTIERNCNEKPSPPCATEKARDF